MNDSPAPATADPIPAPCRLCGAGALPLFRQRVLGKYDVEYFRCPRCDLIQSEHPYWLNEAYASAISVLDTGAIQRNALTADCTVALAWALGVTPASRCLDYGGGHGVFARMMRDQGFDFHWHDRYAHNLFARGFACDPTERFDLVTSFEVFEHFADAGHELNILLSPGHDAVLISTMLHHGHRPGWWYYGPDTGQHVAFYSAATMRYIGERFGYDVLCGSAYTLFISRRRAVGGFRRRILAWLVARARGDATNSLVRLASCLRPRFEPRTVRDNELLRAQLTGRDQTVR